MKKNKKVVFLILCHLYANNQFSNFLLLAATQLNLPTVDWVIYITVQCDSKLSSIIVENGFVHVL